MSRSPDLLNDFTKYLSGQKALLKARGIDTPRMPRYSSTCDNFLGAEHS